MKVFESTRSRGRVLARCFLSRGLAILAGLCALQAQAITVEISATFSPDSANPQINQFKNTTPNSGICQTYPLVCSSRGYFSIGLGGLEATTQSPILAKHSNIRDGAMFKVPADPRPVQVTSASGQVAEVFFAISALSASNRTRDVRLLVGMPTAEHNYAHSVLWDGNPWGWSSPAACPRGAGMYAGTAFANFFWFTPQSVPCGFSPAYEIDSLTMYNISVSYLMISPDPLRMESGIYRGSITYTVGPGGDFDFGDNLAATDNLVTMNFTLNVEHTLKFQFPAGYGSVVLNPAGGWQQWLNNGRRPQKLTAAQDFKMWASTAFSIELQCEFALSDQCAIKNPAGHEVPVETRVTLPNGLRDASNQPVNRLLLSTSPQVFSPSHYVDNRPAALHFEVARDQVASMIDEHSGSTYKGNITVVWNSEV